VPRTWRQLEEGQTAQLWTVDIESGDKSLVYETRDAVIEAPNWTPDGTSLIYNGDGLIYRVPVDGGSPELIDTGEIRDSNNDHMLSPDGRFLYVSSGDGHLYEIALDGAPPRRVSNVHAEPFIYFLHGISPDGATLAYTGAEDVDGNRFGALNIFTVPVAGGDDTQLTQSDKPNDGAEYSPDGAWIYFNSEMASTTPGHAQLFRMRPDGSSIEQLTDDDRVNWFPHLSPDGNRLVYVSYQAGVTGHPANQPIVIRRIDPEGGGHEDVIVAFGGQGTMNVNSWAPDSRRFAFVDYPKD
jgi:TolB protein